MVDEEQKVKKIGLFDFVNSINNPKKQPKIEDKEEIEKTYVPFIINKQFSYFQDTIFIANALNLNTMNLLDKDMQYDFYLATVRPKSRFTKWSKVKNSDVVQALSQLLYISEKEAMKCVHLLNDEQKEHVLELNRVKYGGRI